MSWFAEKAIGRKLKQYLKNFSSDTLNFSLWKGKAKLKNLGGIPAPCSSSHPQNSTHSDIHTHANVYTHTHTHTHIPAQADIRTQTNTCALSHLMHNSTRQERLSIACIFAGWWRHDDVPIVTKKKSKKSKAVLHSPCGNFLKGERLVDDAFHAYTPYHTMLLRRGPGGSGARNIGHPQSCVQAMLHPQLRH